MPNQCPELTMVGFRISFYSCRLKNDLTVIGVMFKIGKENTGLAKLWSQTPNVVGAPVLLKARMIPSEMLPDKRIYYRIVVHSQRRPVAKVCTG